MAKILIGQNRVSDPELARVEHDLTTGLPKALQHCSAAGRKVALHHEERVNLASLGRKN